MTRTITLNDHEYPAYDWHECPIPAPGETPSEPKHDRNRDLLEHGVEHLRPGEAHFHCDQTFGFDTTFTLKGDNRKFVIISGHNGQHVAKPY